MYGIENIKKLVALICETIIFVGSFEQKKHRKLAGWLAVAAKTAKFIWNNWSLLQETYKNRYLVVKELKDLSKTEKYDLENFIIVKFDLANDKIETIIEESIKIIFSIFSLINLLRHGK